MARVDGWVVFVPFALPGERVRARVFRNDKNCSHADLVEVVEASPDRVEPPCPLFGACGGCQYQHVRHEVQLVWKSRQVAELMKHMAGVEFPVNACVSSPQEWHYRSKITPHFERIAFPAERTAVVIDPPRKGCTPEFLDQLIAFGPARLVYVSCDPATQVRDLKQLTAGGYRLEDVQPFDLFPHTRHVECVMTLVRG